MDNTQEVSWFDYRLINNLPYDNAEIRPCSGRISASPPYWVYSAVGVNFFRVMIPSANTVIGGLYFKTDDTIAGFQSRVGCLFFLVSVNDAWNRVGKAQVEWI